MLAVFVLPVLGKIVGGLPHLIPELEVEDCDCGWISIPGACENDDGSYCWGVCCHPTPSGPTPSPHPSTPPPAGSGKPVNLVQEYYAHELRTVSRPCNANDVGSQLHWGTTAETLNIVACEQKSKTDAEFAECLKSWEVKNELPSAYQFSETCYGCVENYGTCVTRYCNKQCSSPLTNDQCKSCYENACREAFYSCGGYGKDRSALERPGPGRSANLTRKMANGFSRQGSMRYHSQEKLNLLGGGLTFTADLSGVQNLVNANLYLVIPGTLDGGSHFYCDNSATFVGQGNACIELDIIESNGHQLVASTMHTHVGTNSGCDTWGCRGLVYFGTIDGNRPFQVSVQVASDGDIKVELSQDGKTAYVFNNAGGWDGAAKQAVVDGMSNHGAIVMTSMWTGWVPPNTSGTGDLGGSHYTLSNLMYTGTSMGNV